MKKFYKRFNDPISSFKYLYIPVYKLDINTGEINVLLRKAIVDVLRENNNLQDLSDYNCISLISFPACLDSFDIDYSNCYLSVFSKKYYNIGNYIQYFDSDYLNKVLELYDKEKLKSLGYLLFCFKEDLSYDNCLWYHNYSMDLLYYGVERNLWEERKNAEYYLKNYYRFYPNARDIPHTNDIDEILESKEKSNNKVFNKIKKNNIGWVKK